MHVDFDLYGCWDVLMLICQDQILDDCITDALYIIKTVRPGDNVIVNRMNANDLMYRIMCLFHRMCDTLHLGKLLSKLLEP